MTVYNQKITAFLMKVDAQLNEAYKETNRRFVYPEQWRIEERMMRIGIESRMLGGKDEEDWRAIAIATLKQDFINR